MYLLPMWLIDRMAEVIPDKRNLLKEIVPTFCSLQLYAFDKTLMLLILFCILFAFPAKIVSRLISVHILFVILEYMFVYDHHCETILQTFHYEHSLFFRLEDLIIAFRFATVLS